MAKTSRPQVAGQTRRSRRASSGTSAKHPVIDNRNYPSTEEVGKILKAPASRIRQMKDLAAEKLKMIELVR